MHDLGRIQMENFEYDFETESGIFSEAETAELATELLEVQSEQELEQFLGDLIKRAGSAIGTFIKSPTGQALGGILKGAAKQALPMVGSALGGWVGGDAGAKLGSKFASLAGTSSASKWKTRWNRPRICPYGRQCRPGGSGRAPKRSTSRGRQHRWRLPRPANTSRLYCRCPRRVAAVNTWIRRGNRIIVLGV